MPTDNLTPDLAVSIVIPTYNAGPEFEHLLARLRDQSLGPIEIIVVDSTSQDETVEIAVHYGARVFTVKQSEFDHGGTRNYAASQATGDILVFMTQDAVPENDSLLEELVVPLENPMIGCAYARQIAKPEANILEHLSRSFNYPVQSARKSMQDIPLLGIKTFFCSNVCSAVRRETFIELGRFPEPVIFNEDLFFAAKCVLSGYSVAYAAGAKVMHSHNYSLKQKFKRYFDNGVSMSMNDWVYPYSSVNHEGSRLIKSQLRELTARKAWKWIPALIGESVAKYLGYQLGKRHRYLPNFLCERFSMHRKIWEKIRSEHKSGMSIKG